MSPIRRHSSRPTEGDFAHAFLGNFVRQPQNPALLLGGPVAMLAHAAAIPPAMPPAMTPAATLAATPAATLATSSAPQLVWMSPGDWHKVVTRRELKAEEKVERPPKITVAAQLGRAHRLPAEWTSSNSYGVCVKRLHTDERAAAAGFDEEWSATAVRRAERAQEDPERAALEREAEARRKRLRRVEDGKEDRDALRELASSRDCDALPLAATPAGLRETAMDGTPRSAKAAGAELRKLTQSFYERLLDPRFYGFEPEDLKNVKVTTEYWVCAHCREVSREDSKRVVRERVSPHWETGVRPLKLFGAKPSVC
jgi:hypothetical protein